MRDERLRALHDPGQITDTQLVRLQQSRGDSNAGWIAKGASETRYLDGSLRLNTFVAEAFGERKVEAEKFAPVIPGHNNNLTSVVMKRVGEPAHASDDTELRVCSRSARGNRKKPGPGVRLGVPARLRHLQHPAVPCSLDSWYLQAVSVGCCSPQTFGQDF